MNRKYFLRQGIAALGAVAIIPLACKKENTSDTGTGTNNGSCSASPTETAGPFPTKNPADLVRADITGDRTGIPLSIDINLKNSNSDCAALAGVLVDIWHCDKDGYYSEYGGSGLQTADFTAATFLRGRQTSDADGQVRFSSIFPGWYPGRATHIHVHVFTTSGTSLLVTQIAFPEGSGSAVATVNGSGGAAFGYTKGMSGYTYNASDGVFSDDKTGVEIATVSGSNAAGYTLTHTINVAT